MEQLVGIDRINLYIPPQYIEMEELAKARGVDPAKFTIGIGQNQMAVTDAMQDIVVLAINAAAPIVKDQDRELIDQVIVATESAFDYSKAASTYVHEALKINPFAKSYEVKEACYAGTAALQSAADYVRLRPDRKVLVIMTDIARYGLNTGGESTQGAGAIAMLITANPAILAIEQESIGFTNNQFDFWRPQYADYPMVEGRFSTQLYNQTFIEVMEEASRRLPESVGSIEALAFHLPFTKMGRKAIKAYRDYLADKEDSQEILSKLDQWEEHYDAGTIFSRHVGNIYTGSLYLCLLSLLINDRNLSAGDHVGLFSYGSGAVAELLFGQLQPGYQDAIEIRAIQDLFGDRQKLSIQEYEEIYQEKLTQSDEKVEYPVTVEAGRFYLAEIDHHRRYYRQAPQ